MRNAANRRPGFRAVPRVNAPGARSRAAPAQARTANAVALIPGPACAFEAVTDYYNGTRGAAQRSAAQRARARPKTLRMRLSAC